MYIAGLAHLERLPSEEVRERKNRRWGREVFIPRWGLPSFYSFLSRLEERTTLGQQVCAA